MCNPSDSERRRNTGHGVDSTAEFAICPTPGYSAFMKFRPRFRGRSLGRLSVRLTVAACVVLATSACMQRGRPIGDDPFRGGSRGGVDSEGGRLTVEVQNLNFNDISVFAFRRGERIRVGDVTGKTDRTFQVPWAFSAPVQFRIEIVSGRSCGTQTVNGDPGSGVWIQVPADVGLSQCRVGRR